MPRRRRPRRPRPEGPEGPADEQTNGAVEGDQQRPPPRRLRPQNRRPFRPRPPPGEYPEGSAPAAPAAPVEVKGKGDVKQQEAPEGQQTSRETADGQKPRRQFTRRRQRNSESLVSKNETEKSALEPTTPTQTSKPADLKSSPKSSPKGSPKPSSKVAPKSPEAPATTVPAPSE